MRVWNLSFVRTFRFASLQVCQGKLGFQASKEPHEDSTFGHGGSRFVGIEYGFPFRKIKNHRTAYATDGFCYDLLLFADRRQRIPKKIRQAQEAPAVSRSTSVTDGPRSGEKH